MVQSNPFSLIGKKIFFLDECPSTNTYLMELCRTQVVDEGTVVFTQHQPAGRGQRGNHWIGERGMNLTFSVLIKPTLTLVNQFLLTQTVSLAVSDFINYHTNVSAIKWPNDIYVHQKKIAGILIENSIVGDVINYSIVGIGVNINQPHFTLPIATSLAMMTNKLFVIRDELSRLLAYLQSRFMQLKDEPSSLSSNYHERLLNIHQWQKFNVGDQPIDAIIQGVDDRGRLVLWYENKTHYYDLSQLKWVM